MNQFIRSKDFTTFIVSVAALVCFGLAPIVQAAGPDTEGAIGGQNNGEGVGVLINRTTGVWNTGTGYQALNHTTSGNQNTGEGYQALFNTTTGKQNTASGALSLFSNTTGNFNTATGFQALSSNTATGNSAFGHRALGSNTSGLDNTAVGFQAARHNTIGDSNTANGYQALFSNNDGTRNNAFGTVALFSQTTNNFNNAFGALALYNNISACCNEAFGDEALFSNTGVGNTAIGDLAGVGATTGDGNVYIGEGMLGAPGESNHTYIRNIYGVTTTSATTLPVIVSSDGQLGTAASSRRFKKDIKMMNKASEALLALKPVTFHYKSDSTGTPQFGLVAEEVAEVNPDLVVRDDKGDIYTVRYDAVNAMLLNEFLKEHKNVEAQNRRIQEQDGTITQLKKEMETVVARLKKQDSKIQRVSDRIELSKPAPRTVLNSQ